ncbi:MAG TPA: DUF6514 family protein [Mobilitalea sp.]|nr:DUF6514 family protein [Mobilitalea sp.]
MKKVQLLFSNEVLLEDERKMKLDYNLTEKYAETDQTVPFYGVQITKHLGDTIETEEVAGISYSRDTVVSMLKKLFQFEVTPISMIEILDEIVTEGI